MIEFGKEYFEKPYYFYIKDRGDKISLYYSVSETISESRKNDEELEYDKEDAEKLKRLISKLFSVGKKLPKNRLEKMLRSIKSKKEIEDGELNEFIGADGSFTKSNIPMLNQRLVTKSTTDQTVHMSRAQQWPFIRVYYGESEEEKENLIDEIDITSWFGGEETKYAKNYKEASKIIKNMGIKDPFNRHERLEDLGFDPEYDDQLEDLKRSGFCKNCFVKKRLTELEKGKMQKMIDEIILGKKNKSEEIMSKKDKEEPISVMEKLLLRNLESIRNLADKQGIEFKDLLTKINKGE